MAEAATSEASQRNQIAEVLMEHFGFVPQAFSRRASDLANEVLYSTMDSIEKVVKERLGSSENVDKGLYTLETLLENQIDMRLDQYEAYLYRNVFTVQPPELLPYLKLDHQPDAIASTSRVTLEDEGHDERLLAQIADERKALDEEMQKNMDLEVANERMNNRALALAAVEQALEESGWGISQNPKDVTAALTAIEKQLPDLLEASKTLANSAPSTSLSAQSDTTTPWSNRESYVPWAAQRMASEAGEGASFGVADVKASMRSGTQENAEVSFADKILEDLAQMEGLQALTRALRGSK